MNRDKSRTLRWLRQLLPWVLAIAVIAVLLGRVSVSQIIAEVQRGDAWPIFPLALALEIASLWLLARADAMVIGAIVELPRPFRIVPARAATTMLDAVGYALGRASYGVWLGKRTGAGVEKTSGMLLYLVASDFASVSVVASAAIAAGDSVPIVLRYAAPVAAALLIGVALAGPSLPLPARDAFLPLRISRSRAALQLVLRVAQVFLYTATSWAAARAFGIAMPLRAMATYLPLALVVEALPVNVAGFGAAQAVWLLLVSPAIPAEKILAFHFVWQLSVVASMVAVGLVFWHRFSRDLAEPTAAETSRARETPDSAGSPAR